MNSKIWKDLTKKFNKTDELLSEFEMTMIHFAMFDSRRGHTSLFETCELEVINQFFDYCDHKQYDYFNSKPQERWQFESEFLNAIKKPTFNIPVIPGLKVLGGDCYC